MTSFLDLSSQEDVQKLIDKEDTCILFCSASWVKSSTVLFQELKKTLVEIESENGHTVVINLDLGDDEMQETALSFDMKDVPCVHIFKDGAVCAKFTGSEVTISNITNAVKRASRARAVEETGGEDDIIKLVAAAYAATVAGSESCCVSADSKLCGEYILLLLTILTIINYILFL